MTSPHLVSEYHQARLLVVVTASLVFLWRLGVSFEGRIPILDFTIHDDTRLPYILACVLSYSIIRLVIEWFQSEPERRRRLPSRIDLCASLLIAGGAGWVLAAQLIPHAITKSFLEIPVIPALVLIVVGITTGKFMDTLIFSLAFIRRKEEARQLALPRVPVAVRAMFRMGYTVILPSVVLVLLLTPGFSEPLRTVWPWFLFSPIVILLLTGTAAFVVRRHTRPDGTAITRKEFVKETRAAFDDHDARYQIGGWDKRIKTSNTPLYRAAETGDQSTVERLLLGGANPNEPNALGWTALMIAVANQHWETAKILLVNGANPNLNNLIGRNALMFAARYGREDFVRELIKYGADVNRNKSRDSSALGAAAANGHSGVVQILLEAGADPTIRDKKGNTPEHYAELNGNGEIAALLRRSAHGQDRKSSKGSTP